jgi:hypothetical protein
VHRDEDWQVGDKAVHCKDLPPCGFCEGDAGGDDGRILTVSAVYLYINEPVGIDFKEWPAKNAGYICFCSCQFRKIKPDEHEPCSESFKQLLTPELEPA